MNLWNYYIQPYSVGPLHEHRFMLVWCWWQQYVSGCMMAIVLRCRLWNHYVDGFKWWNVMNSKASLTCHQNVFFLNNRHQQWCYRHWGYSEYSNTAMLVTLWWCQFLDFVDKIIIFVTYFRLCWWLFQYNKSVTNISNI